MSIEENKIKSFKNIYLIYFAILNVLCLITCFIDLKLGVTASIVILLIWMISDSSSEILNNGWFLLYIIANFISVLAYLWNGRPIKIFFSAISFNVIPALLYCFGSKAYKSNKNDELLLKMLNAFIFMMVFGTITYLLFPNFYYEYIGQSIEDYEYGLGEYRYGSYISSLALGSTSCISLILYFKELKNLKLWQKVFYILIILLNILMCMQRSAWLLAVISLFVILLIKIFIEKKQIKNILALLILALVAGVFVWIFRESIFTPTQLQYFISRFGSLSLENMVSSRSDQWEEAFKIFIKNPILGFGLGSVGQKAAPYNMAVVTDGNHLRILAELGLLGFIPFLAMNIKAIYGTIKSKEYYLTLIIVICNLAAIGSPIFDQFYASFAYWMILGYCCRMCKQSQTKKLSGVSI